MSPAPRPPSSLFVRIVGGALRTRWIVTLPLHLYRWGLGGVFGGRLIVLEHIGRKTGKPHLVALEVLEHSEAGYVVASGFGQRSQWYQNLVARPHIRFRVRGHKLAPATAEPLDAAERARTLSHYIANSPRAWSVFQPVLEETLGQSIDETSTNLPMMRIVAEDPAR